MARTSHTPRSADEQQVKATFTLRAGVGAVAVGLRIAGAVDAEILSCDWLIAVTWTQFAPLRLSTVEMARLTELWQRTHTRRPQQQSADTRTANSFSDFIICCKTNYAISAATKICKIMT